MEQVLENLGQLTGRDGERAFQHRIQRKAKEARFQVYSRVNIYSVKGRHL